MNVLQKVYFVLLFITLLMYCFAWMHKAPHAKMILSIVTLWLLTSAAAMFFSKVMGLKNNLFIFHIATPLEYIFIALLYRDAIVSKNMRTTINVSIPAFVILSIIFSVFIQKPDVNNSYIVLIEYVIVVFLSLFFLREVMLLQQVTVLHRFSMFWISVGILFYYTGNLLIEGMLNYMINHSMDLALRTYNLSYILKYLIFVLFIVGASCILQPLRIKKSP